MTSVLAQSPAVQAYAEKQDLKKTRHAQVVTEELAAAILGRLRPGMTETEARKMALQVSESRGITVQWHRVYVRFGENSLLTFKDKGAPERTLQEDDIAFIDIGPVVDGVEGDFGRTVVFGENPLYLALQHECERIFFLAKQYWKDHQPTGVALYEYVQKLTEEAGYIFNLDPAGHLVGEHPHLGWKKGLNHYAYIPQPGLWILEIQIRHPELPYGAFYESLLI